MRLQAAEDSLVRCLGRERGSSPVAEDVVRCVADVVRLLQDLEEERVSKQAGGERGSSTPLDR